MSELLEVSTGPIAAAVVETGKCWPGANTASSPSVLRFTSAAALRDFLATDMVPARPRRLVDLGDPALTGMSRADLTKLIGRPTVHQAAANGASISSAEQTGSSEPAEESVFGVVG